MAAIPDRRLQETELPDPHTRGLLYSQLTLLESRMFHGDPCAVQLAFRLRRLSDAAFGEDLSAAIGALATTRPRLFLTQLSRSGMSCEPVLSFDSDYTSEELQNECALRTQRLRQVDIPTLLDVRDRCLALLEASH